MHPASGEKLNPAEQTVLVVDDDASFLTAMSRMLRASGYKVRAFESAEAFLAEGGVKENGCLLVDLKMPGLSGLELQEKLTGDGSALAVVFLTGEGDVASSVRAMKRGAEDFLVKTAPQAELLDAVNRALGRARAQSESSRKKAELKDSLAALTERELQVLSHVVRGRLNKQIGEELGINERTVKLHRTNLTRKLGVPSAAELTTLYNEAQSLGVLPAASLKG